MARSCRICSHPQRQRIDRALAAGQSPRQLAHAFLSLTRKQIEAHRRRCLMRNPLLVHALRAGELTYEEFDELLQAAGKSEEEAREIVADVREHLGNLGREAS